MKKIFSIIFILGVIMLIGCQKTNDNTIDNNTVANNDSTGNDSELVDTNTKLTPEDFAKNKLTVLNVWATWCPPCVAELPELQKVSEEYKDKDVEVIGVLHDGIIKLGTPNEEVIDSANTLMQDNGVNFLVILPDEYLQTEFLGSMQAFPTTFFIDSEGNLVDTIVGANNFETWGKLIDETLEELEK